MPTKQTAYPILIIIGISHLLNDTIQAVVPAMFPILEQSLGLTFTQLGLIVFTLNMISSVMQPVVGVYTDKNPQPYALPIGLAASMLGIFLIAISPNLWWILISVVFIGFGSATFHPEGARVAYLGAGPKRGLAQSIYQVGGNTGQALAPVMTALVLVPLGQIGAMWFTLVAGLAVLFLLYIAKWYKNLMVQVNVEDDFSKEKKGQQFSKKIGIALAILVMIGFVRSWYVSSIGSFYAFYVIDIYHATIAKSQIYVFVFLIMGAIGTFLGGPLADRFGKKKIILLSIIFSIPFSIMLPHVGAKMAIIILAIIGIVIMSSFSITVVYAQELIPGKVGTMSGLITGLAFGAGSIGTVGFGTLIDSIGIQSSIIVLSFLPILGLITIWLPSDTKAIE